MIERLDLTNVLAFREISLEFRGLTLLSGTNSAGKTSILHAIALLRQSELAKTLPEALLLNGQYVELGTGRDVLHTDTVEIADVEAIALAIALCENGTDSRWVAGYERDANLLPVVKSEGPGSVFSAGFEYLKADRIVPAVTFPKSHEAVSTAGTLGASGEHAPNFLRVRGHEPILLREAAHPDAESGVLRDQVNAWVNELSPGTRVGATDIEGTDFVRLQFSRTGPDVSSEAHRATNVGFGLTYALPVIIAALMANRGELLLIENPEAHLHPRGQAMLGRLCALAAAGGAQVVVETHSDHVLNAVRLAVKRGELPSGDAVMHFFTRTDGVLQPDHSSIAIGSDGMIERWPRGFFDQWDVAVDELLDGAL